MSDSPNDIPKPQVPTQQGEGIAAQGYIAERVIRLKSEVSNLLGKIRKDIATSVQTNGQGAAHVLSMLYPGSHFGSQSLENLKGTFIKPEDDLYHGRDAQTAILIPGFLCNQQVMAQLGAKLSPSMNVVYPDIGVLEQLHKSLPELANDIAMYIENLENTGKLKVGGEYILIGHSLGGSLALMVSSKLRARHIIQVSTPNEIPAVSKISGFGWFPALVDLRNIKQVYGTIRPVQPIGRLTSIIPKNDRFIGPDVQGTGLLPPNILSQVGTTDGVIVQGGHIDPIDTPSGIANIVRVANGDMTMPKRKI